MSRALSKLDTINPSCDPRTGGTFTFPVEWGVIVPKGDRVAWEIEQRAQYIAEWHRRGYPTPMGGWDRYDIHHIHPREYGGGNDF